MTTTETAGCQHREHKNAPTCKKLCDPGESLCPHHLLLAAQVEQRKSSQKTAGTNHATPRAYSK
jgi:hypothetical protein